MTRTVGQYVVMEHLCYCGICPTYVGYNPSTDQAVRDRRCRGACAVSVAVSRD